MVHQSKKKKKVVQPAEAKTPKKDDSVAPVQDVSEEQPEVSDVPAMPFDLSQVDPAKIKLAEEMGIPITQIIQWAMSVEKRFEILIEELAKSPEKVVEVLKAEAAKAQTARVQQMQQQGATTQQGGGSDLITLLKTLGVGGGGGSVDTEMSGLMKDMFRLNMDRMKQDMTNSMLTAQADAELSKTLKNALATELAKKTAKNLLD